MILNKVYSMLGLAAKAGKIASGEFMTERSVKDGSACLVVVATDASDNTKKNFRDMCTYYHVPIEEYGSKDELGHAIGKEMRASLAINDQGFANSVQSKIESSKKTGGSNYE